MTSDTYSSLGRQKGYFPLSDVKYRYALDDHQLVIDINSDLAIKGKDYTCLSCGKVLRPVKGEIRQKHFRHKAQVTCSPETYLHNLAKQIFYQVYSECLAKNKPFIFEYRVPKSCCSCKSFGPCNVGFELKRTDLTRYFKEIYLETRDGSFIPDILLKNAEEILYIEIAVTHFVEENKEKSGIRIIEIAINNESDVGLITSCCISEKDARVMTSNFRPTPVTGDFAYECINKLHCFILYPSGKSIITEISARKYEVLSASKGIHIEVIDHDKGFGIANRIFVDKVSELYQQGKFVKNCWLCVFHGLHFRTHESFCKLKKRKFARGETNLAVECSRYKPKESIPECGLIEDALFQLKKSHAEWSNRQQVLRSKAGGNKDNLVEAGLVDEFFVRMLGDAAQPKQIPDSLTDTTHPGFEQNPTVLPIKIDTVNEQPRSGKKAACVFCGKVLEYESDEWWMFDAEKGECKCNSCLTVEDEPT